MRHFSCIIILLFALTSKLLGQACGAVQSLSPTQQSHITALIAPLDTALTHEDLFDIDSLSAVLKNIYATQGGIPDAAETYYPLNSNTSWLSITNALLLSRVLIAADSMVYVDLWKAAKGMNPPLYQPNSLFLRAPAEIASGLLKIADKETDLTRKALYQAWAIRALDSLTTMQLPNGAFPFPDLRTYGDPVFTPIIQNFLNSCGADSVNVLQNGWIINDKGSGEFKFDAGVIANAYYEAYHYTGKIEYKNIVIAIGDYLKTLKFNLNYNYNSFVSLGLTRAYQLSSDTSYLNRALKNLRFAVYPGQINNGRWLDGHNANSRYHAIILQNLVPTVLLIPTGNSYKNNLDSMAYKAVKNMVDYTNTCNSATGYRWLIDAYGLSSSIIPNTLNDSICDLIGRYINQSAANGKYLDVPVMGDYLELLGFITGATDFNNLDIALKIFPNPATDFATIEFTLNETQNIEIVLYNAVGKALKNVDNGVKYAGNYHYQLDLSNELCCIYFLTVKTEKGVYTSKIIRIE